MATERARFQPAVTSQLPPPVAPPMGRGLSLPAPVSSEGVSTGVTPPVGGAAPATGRLRPTSAAGGPHARSTRVGRAVLTAAAAGLVIVSTMAVAGAVPVWGTPGGPATAAGSIAAMSGAYLCLMLLLLAARIPSIEREVGHPALIAVHRRVAPYAVGLVCAHVLLTTLGYAQAAETGLGAQLADLVLHTGWMLPAFSAFVMLVLLSVLSYRRLRDRLRYETWWVAHLYLYLAVALAFGHQLENSSFLDDQPAFRALWSVLYAGVFATVVVSRLALPGFRSLWHDLRVDGVVRESDDVVSLYISGKHLDRWGAEGGQFFQWRFLARRSWWQAHPYSLSAAPTPNRLRITVREVGDQSAAVADLRPGTRIWAEGPYGIFTAGHRSGDRVVAFVAGIGITPVLAMLHELPRGAEVDVVVRARSLSAAPLLGELEQLASDRGFRVWHLEGPRRRAPLRLDAVLAMVPDLARSDVYVCGPEGFTDRVLSIAERAGVPASRIHHESFAV